jgi:hypothetical protein
MGTGGVSPGGGPFIITAGREAGTVAAEPESCGLVPASPR